MYMYNEWVKSKHRYTCSISTVHFDVIRNEHMDLPTIMFNEHGPMSIMSN